MIMKKGRKLIPIIMLCCLIFPLSATGTETFVDDNYISWTTIEEKVVEDIIYDDDSFLYLQVSGNSYKINKDFSSELITVEEQEKDALKRLEAGKSYLSAINEKDIKVKDNYLYYKDQKLMDVSSYIEKNEQLCQDNLGYEKKIHYFIRHYQLSNSDEVFFITTSLNYWSAPYNPQYTDILLLRNEKVCKLDTDPGFRLEKVLENADGSVWISGWIKGWKSSIENTLYLLDRNNEISSINKMIKKNDIEILGREPEGLIIKAVTRKLSCYSMLDLDKYSNENQGIFSINSGKEIKLRPEVMEDYQYLYMDNKHEIYAVSADSKRLKNLSTGREKELEAKESDYDSYLKILRAVSDEDSTQSAFIRKDRDGSSWYLRDYKIIHNANGIEQVFDRGLEVMMYPVENIFIDFDGGKWFLGCAGIAYYGNGYSEAKNMNPLLEGGIYPGRYDALYVDGNKKIWFFDEQIKCVSFEGDTALPAGNEYVQGFRKLSHPYAEIDGKGLFAYDKENTDGSYSLRIISIDRNGKIEHRDLMLDKFVKTLFSRDEALYIVLEDGFIKIEKDKVYEIRNPKVRMVMSFDYIDKNNMAFAGTHDIIAIHLPYLSEKVDEFEKDSQEFIFNGKPIRAFKVQNQLAICIEDLQNYGYDIVWDSDKRATFITYKPDKAVNAAELNTELLGEKGDIYYSDVEIYLDGKKIPSYNTGGYSLVKLKSLEDFFDIQVTDVICINKR